MQLQSHPRDHDSDRECSTSFSSTLMISLVQRGFLCFQEDFGQTCLCLLLCLSPFSQFSSVAQSCPTLCDPQIAAG